MSNVKTIDKIEMKNDWVFVDPIEEDEKYGKIIVPEFAKEGTQKGRIVSIGKGGDKNLKLKDVVLFRQRGGYKPVEIDGRRYLAMKRAHILGIMFGENAVDVTPLKENVFLEWEKAQAVYEGTNFIRPDSHREMHYTGAVLAIGPDVKEVKVGDHVFFDQFAGVEKFQEYGKRFAFITQGDVYCSGVPRREAVAA